MYHMETKDVRGFLKVILTLAFFVVFVHLESAFFDKMV